MMIFLGAGASKPFEIPTMSELMKGFEDKSIPENEKLLYEEIKDRVRPPLEINLEDILTTLNSLSKISENQRTSTYFESILEEIRTAFGNFEPNLENTLDSIRRAPFGILGRVFRLENALKTLENELKSVSKHRQKVEKGCSLIDPHCSKNLRDRLIRFIKECCIVRSDGIGTLLDVYDRFFDCLDIDNLRKIDIFTTNYDCCVETYFGRKGIMFCDGFRFNSLKRIEYFDPKSMMNLMENSDFLNCMVL